jgi:hypothetical protein
MLLKWLAPMITLSGLALAVPGWVRSRGRIRGDLGLGPNAHGLRDGLAGAAIGTLAMVGVFGAEWGLGYLRPGAWHGPGWGLASTGLLLAAGALIEELVFRGGVLNGLRRLMPTWAAVACSAAIFGLAHLANPHATALSAFSNALGGVMYAHAFLGSRSIWLPFGLHFAWNAVQGPVLGFPVSGLAFGGLLHPVVQGPLWMTGAAYGPEGGLPGVLARLAVLAMVAAVLRAGRASRPGA